jgi:hypothetical protein
MITKKITACNKFHKTETYIIAKGETRFFINRRQFSSMWMRLCGIDGCCCSVDLTDKNGNKYELACHPSTMVNTDTYELLAI